MLGYYDKSRSEIVKMIKKCPTTEDGYYYCQRFPKINEKPGEESDKGYTFDRNYFKNKICFNLAELEVYLERGPSYFNIDKMKTKDDFLYGIIKPDLTKRLNKKIRNTQYTLGELIDSAIFYFNYTH
jgi:hypothetical protein